MKPSDHWKTPPRLFLVLSRAFGPFYTDPCAEPDNHLGTPVFYDGGENGDGLQLPWRGKVYMNPPYSQTMLWVRRAWEMVERGVADKVVGLLRYDPSTRWWNFVEKGVVYRVPMRIRFVGAPASYNFPSAVVVWTNLAERLRETRLIIREALKEKAQEEP